MSETLLRVANGGPALKSGIDDLEEVIVTTLDIEFGISAAPAGFVLTADGAGGASMVAPTGASTGAVSTIEIDLGTVPVKSKSLTVTVPACDPSFNVMVCPSADPATGRGSDDGLWDGLIMSAVAGTGEFTLHVLAVPGPVSGKRIINYQFGT